MFAAQNRAKPNTESAKGLKLPAFGLTAVEVTGVSL